MKLIKFHKDRSLLPYRVAVLIDSETKRRCMAAMRGAAAGAQRNNTKRLIFGHNHVSDNDGTQYKRQRDSAIKRSTD